MKITLNPDAELVRTVKEGLKQTGGSRAMAASRSAIILE